MRAICLALYKLDVDQNRSNKKQAPFLNKRCLFLYVSYTEKILLNFHKRTKASVKWMPVHYTRSTLPDFNALAET